MLKKKEDQTSIFERPDSFMFHLYCCVHLRYANNDVLEYENYGRVTADVILNYKSGFVLPFLYFICCFKFFFPFFSSSKFDFFFFCGSVIVEEPVYV